MEIINNNAVAVETFNELKTILEEENDYTYIYLKENIDLESKITINVNKTDITIDGTYQDTRHTYINTFSDTSNVITAVSTNKNIVIKNMDISSANPLGVINVPSEASYSDVVVEYINITFNGVQLSYNYYGKTKIKDAAINIKNYNNVQAQRVANCTNIEIDGNTNITSESTQSSLFIYRDIQTATFIFLPNSTVIIDTPKELMNGTNKLFFKISHGAYVNIKTGNGFAVTTTHGANNVLIEQEANFTFIENSHQRVPMWNIYGNFIVNQGASVSILNTYMTTPSDNYNLYFKGTNQKFILNNPRYINIYTKNANAIYTNNLVEYSIITGRINMWTTSLDYTSACTIDDPPVLYWYGFDKLISIKGTITTNDTSITKHNLTADELALLPDLNNFKFQSRKIITMGKIKSNIHQINSTKNKITGHTSPLAFIKVEYGNVSEKIEADSNGLFEHTASEVISDDTEIKFTIVKDALFETRTIKSPFTGELTLFSVTNNSTFDLNAISKEPIILPRISACEVKVIDSRNNSTNWDLYINYLNPMQYNDNILHNSLIFKKFDNEIITLKNAPIKVYEGEKNDGTLKITNITFSKDKGLLFTLKENNLKKNDDYTADIIWSIK